MPELADVTINGDPFMLATTTRGGPPYERSAESPAPVKPGRLSLSTFNLGLGWASDDLFHAQRAPGAGRGGWAGLNVHAVATPGGHPAPGGSGLEPWPFFVSHADAALLDVPSSAIRAGGLVANGHVYIHNGTRLYKSVALTNPAWANLAPVAAFPGPCFDLGYFRDDVLAMLGMGADIVRWQTASSAAITWRAGYRGHFAQGYAGAMLFGQVSPAVREVVFIGGTATDGTATLDSRWLDAPIVRMGMFGGSAVIATQQSLFLMDGHSLRVTGAAALWDGEAAPLFSHGAWVNAAAGDFVFLLSLAGKLYTWLGGGVMEYDPAATGGDAWRRTGPGGANCYGACIAAGHLIVALTTAAGAGELWAFDGTGWWRLLSQAAPGPVWPVALNGAGTFDLLVFTSGSTTYRLARLAPRSAATHAYHPTGTWTSPLLTAGNADATKVWRQVAAHFAWPDAPGNGASSDQVTLSLEYSVDAGESWTVADTETVAIGHEQQLALELGGPGGAPPVSRLLQLRVTWSSVLDWAPVLSRLVVDYAIVDTAPRRRQWKLKVLARDQNVARAAQGAPGVLAASGREQIDALFAAWRDQATVPFRDIDYDDHPAELTVRVIDIKEETSKPSDAGHWGDGVVTLTLAEL